MNTKAEKIIQKTTGKKPDFKFALITLVALVAFIVIGTMIFKINLRMMFFLSWLPTIGAGKLLGYTYKDMETAALDTVRTGLQPAIILLVVGAMIATWIASGTVPAIIYYGMKIVNPTFFLPIVMIICSITSLFTGTSWGTIGTAGLAMVGIGMGMDMNVGLVIGAVVSGAFFGDKMSPISDTTIMSAALTGTPVMKHVRHMMYTVVPAYLISMVLYFIFGLQSMSGSMDLAEVNITMGVLSDTFKMGIIPLIPMFLVFYLLATGKPSIPSILGGAVVGAIIAIAYQGYGAGEVFNMMYNGFTVETGNSFVDQILNRGGVTSMRDFTNMMIGSFAFAGMLKGIGVLDGVVNPLISKVKTGFQAVVLTGIIEIAALSTGSTQSFANVMTGTLMGPLFKSLRYKPENLSRAMEDFGTQGGPLIPWGVNALYVAGMYGVDPLTFIPYTFLCWIVPIISLIYAKTGWFMTKYAEGEEIPPEAYPF